MPCQLSAFETNPTNSSVSSPGSDFPFQLQRLAEANITPSTGLTDQEQTRLTAAKRTLDQNYYEVDTYIDGDLATNPMFICRQEKREDEGFEALRLLHNYLSSLYSFNETIRVLFNRSTTEGMHLMRGDFTPSSGGTSHSYYARKLCFLRGLRTDFQHGGFSCLSFDKAGELEDFGGYHLVFDTEAFVRDSGLDGPSRFLRYSNDNEQRHPLCYIGQFHQETLQDFYDDSEAWFNSV